MEFLILLMSLCTNVTPCEVSMMTPIGGDSLVLSITNPIRTNSAKNRELKITFDCQNFSGSRGKVCSIVSIEDMRQR
jgi:hypothetical protein